MSEDASNEERLIYRQGMGNNDIPSGVTQVYVEEGVERIEALAFDNSMNRVNLLQHVDFRRCLRITLVPIRAFFMCNSLKTVNLPPNLDGIGPRAFQGCSLLQDIIFPKSLRMIQYCAFDGCTELKKLKFPNGLRRIENRAFGDSLRLELIEFESVDTFEGCIEQYPFFGCTGLNSIKFCERGAILPALWPSLIFRLFGNVGLLTRGGQDDSLLTNQVSCLFSLLEELLVEFSD